ncbi:putative aarF domain-containing protein kinase 2 isoform X1 [Microtus pennsylvanicus]|uniref:putative aarF domain-containing protein kinase 2 isoform X1 n=1 Tax=Microtus pennsylvanicus TaxID=10058 RepID=UPI003F6AFB02
MVTLWRLSVRVCLSHLRCSEFRKEFGLPRPLGCSRNARLCWFLLGTLPKFISAHGDVGEGAPGTLCQRKTHWSDLAGNGRVEVAQAGPLGRVLLCLRLGLRAGILLAKFFPLLFLYPLTYLAPGFSTLWLHLLLKATETSGPTYIKLGQWASTRHDLFSEAFCAQFSKLHVQVTPHPWAHTECLLQQAFGEDWGSLLFFETQEPVGSGCVAQVYKAFASTTLLEKDRAWRLGQLSVPWLSSGSGAVWMLGGSFVKEWKPSESLADEAFVEKLLLPKADLVRSEGSMPQVPGHPPKSDHLVPVAVKVLHPGLLTQVYMDLLLMKIGSQALGLLPGVKWLSLPEIVEEFEKLMVQQIDLRYEARNLEHFQHNFENMTSVRFPTPLHPLITRDILVETYEESVPVSSYQQAGIPDDLKRRIAQLGINMLLKMIFVDNFVHGDLHPGNILVQGAGGLSPRLDTQQRQVNVHDTLVTTIAPALCPLRLVLLDAGIVSELQASDLRNFRAVFLAVALGQGHRVAELILHHARANECKDVERFKAEMATLVTQARKNTLTLEKLHVSSLLSSVFKLLMTHKVKLESNFASIVFAIMVLEGLGRSLDPKLDILEAAKPFLLQGGGFL